MGFQDAIAPVASLLAFCVVAFFNGLASSDVGNDLGVFLNSTGDISDKFYIEITPAGWTFSIWGFIYTYQVIFLGYWLSLLCRKNPTTGEPLIRSPGFMCPWISLFYVLNNALNVGWLFAWDRQKLVASFILLASTVITLYIPIGISMWGLAKHRATMIKEGLQTEIRLVIGIVHNGLAMYATWVSIATLLNLAMMLTYEYDMKQNIASTIALCVLALDLVVYIFVDNIFLERHFRYLYTPYIVLHVALIGSISKNWDEDSSNSILTAGLLVIGPVATLFKLILSIYRTRTNNIYPSRSLEAI